MLFGIVGGVHNDLATTKKEQKIVSFKLREKRESIKRQGVKIKRRRDENN